VLTRVDVVNNRFAVLRAGTEEASGGAQLAEEVIWWAVHCEDGGGAPTAALSPALAGHLGAPSPIAVAEGLCLAKIAPQRLLLASAARRDVACAPRCPAGEASGLPRDLVLARTLTGPHRRECGGRRRPF
jgi:hypothetical protein